MTLPCTINNSTIFKSKEKAFFIQYTPDGTRKARLYLVQVDM